MRILAMDLSLNCPGFAVLEVEDRKVKLLETLAVKNAKDAAKAPEKRKSTAQKLVEIASVIYQLVHVHKPDLVVRERGFSRFPAATQSLFKVVGVSDLVVFDAAHQEIYEIAPTAIKIALTGNGRAEKDAVAQQLAAYVGARRYLTNDESDAAAVGIAWAIREGWIDSNAPSPKLKPKGGKKGAAAKVRCRRGYERRSINRKRRFI